MTTSSTTPVASPGARRARPAGPLLLVTSDAALIEDVLRVAGAVGLEVEVITDVSAARSRWGSAARILVGADLVGHLLDRTPPRRSDVLLLAREGMEPESLSVALRIGAEELLALPQDESSLAARLSDLAEGPSRGGRVVAVRGAVGGVGASTVAVLMALTAARAGQRTLLVDLDSAGAGIDVILGLDDDPGMRWPDLDEASGRISPGVLDHVLPHVNDVAVVSWDRRPLSSVSSVSVKSVLAAGVRGYDLVVVDHARADAAHHGITNALSATILVTDGSVRSIVAASRLLCSPGVLVDPVHLVVRGSADDADTVTEMLGVAPRALFTHDPTVRRSADVGEVPALRRRGPLVEAARAAVEAVIAPGTAPGM